eukprot:scaffold1.g5387.t1
MYVKQIIIEGFKSYKDQTIADPFSPKINVVVGANGSGKSNFFHAIRFVLNDLFTTERKEERQKLLHEGAGHAVMSAYVEVVFDNSDGRLPVRLRRTIGLKKDEFYLDKKHITRSEVMNLLETAGFSRANPYYVVQQGRIMSMANMKDEERLNLLKEIGGTKVYEERRKESMALLRDCEGKRHRIQELVGQLEERLGELEQEREELERYQALDKQRRSLEFTLYDRDVTDLKARLDQIDRQRQEVNDKASRVHDEMRDAQIRLKEVERGLRGLAAKQADLRKQQQELAGEREEALRRRAKAELDVKDLEDRMASDAATQEDCTARLSAVDEEIARAEGELARVAARAAAAQARERGIEAEAEARRLRRQALLAKAGRNQNFNNREERDEWLRKEMGQLEATLAARRESAAAIERQLADLGAELAVVEESIAEQAAALEERGEAAGRTAAALREAHDRRDGLANQQKALWRRQEELETVQLTDLLNRGKLGRASFMPLNRLNPPQVSYPDKYGKDVVPLMKYLRCDDRFRPAMQQARCGVPIFGKTLVCRDLETATLVAAETNLNCVTMDGDQELGTRQAEGHRELQKVKRELEGLSQEITAASEELGRLEQKARSAEGGSGSLRAELRDAQARKAQLEKAAESKRRQLGELGRGVETLEKELGQMRGELGTELSTDLSSEEQAELAALQPALAAGEGALAAARAERLEVAAEQEALEATLSTNLRKQRDDLQERMAAAGGGGGGGAGGGTTGAAQAAQAGLAARQADAAAAATAVQQVSEREKEVSRQLEEAGRQLKELVAEKEELRERVQADNDAHKQDERKVLESLANKRAVASHRKADLEKRIRELGSLPADAFEKYRGRPHKELQAQLQKVNGELKRFGHVNRKALDQYVNFAEQRDELVRRKADNDRGNAKIEQLIGTLDLRKDEAIERTFRGVAKNFRDIFAQARHGGGGRGGRGVGVGRRLAGGWGGVERRAMPGWLVPGGSGALVMDDGNGGGEAGPSHRNGTADKYSGVKVRVSFGGGETHSMRSLSGGQKTLVALALILAIQRCDPAPFYLFDEIDAALDPQYRSTVAAMLRQQANDPRNPSQFIITTFHPQLVQIADRIYGVSHSNRISRIDTVAAEDALEFLQAGGKRRAEERRAAAAAAVHQQQRGGAAAGRSKPAGGRGKAAARAEAPQAAVADEEEEGPEAMEED